MKSILFKILIIICLIFVAFYTNVQAATFGLKASKTEVTVGESFNVTISGIYGKVTISGSNTSISPSGSQFVDGSLTLTCNTNKEGTAKVTVTAHEAATTGANPQEVSETKSVTVNVKAKPIVEQPKPPAPTNTQTSNKTNTSNKPTTTKKTTTTTKKTETKKETPVVETKEEEEATPLWGISEVKLIGVKENDEKIDLELDKKFDINTYEYLCNVSNDVKRIEVQKEAYEYNEFVTITGIEEDLKDGENIITLKLSKEGQNELLYTIKVNKEAKQEEIQSVSAEVIENKDEKKNASISMPVWSFILLEFAIVIITAVITFFVTKKIILSKDKTKKYTNDDNNKFEELN